MSEDKKLKPNDKWEITVNDELVHRKTEKQNSRQDQSDSETKDEKSLLLPKRNEKNDDSGRQGLKRGYSDMERGEFFNPRKPFFSLEIAQRHALANRVYKESMESSMSDTLNINPQDICPCCYHVVRSDNDLIDVFTSPTYPMYFQFMRYSIVLVAIMFLISGIYSLIENQKGHFCEEQYQKYKNDPANMCIVSITNTTATSNRGLSEADQTYAILNLITCIVLMIYSTAFRYVQIQFEREIDQSDVSVSDFTLFINKIPKNKTRQDITEFLQSQVPGIKVEKIIQCFKLTKHNQLNYEMLRAQDEKTREELDIQIEEYERQCFNEQNIEEIFTGAAFVCLEKEEQVIQAVDHFYYNNFKQFIGLEKQDKSKLFDGAQLNVWQAREPGDTNWDNFDVSTKSKVLRRSFTMFLTFLFLALSFWAIFAIGDYSGEIRRKEKDQYKLLALSVFSSMVILFINYAIWYLIFYCAEYEAYNFKTDTVISVAKKSGIAQFINTTIVSFFVSLILNGNSVWINGGLVNTVTVLAVTNAFFPAAMSLMQAENITKWLYQQRFLRLSDQQKQTYSQMQVHALFEGPIFYPAGSFATAANCLLFAAFYSWIIPMGLPFCIISLTLQFYVNKYKLLRRQNTPIPLGTSLPEEMVDFYFELIILLFALGCFTFEVMLYGSPHPYTFIMVIAAVVFYFLPINEYMDNRFNTHSNYIETMTYQEAKTSGQFSTDYDRKNPILRSRAIKKYVNHLIDNEKDIGKKDLLHSVFYILPSQKDSYKKELSQSTIQY